MRDHTVELDQSESPAAIRISPVFNVAVPFIDRHLDEGRADKAAIRTVDEEVTYAELAERVNRCGNALLNLGVGPGERVLMMVKDCPEFLYTFFGAIKAGAVPVPVNTMLRVQDYTYLVSDSGCAALVYSPEFADTISPEACDPWSGHRPMSADGIPIIGATTSVRNVYVNCGHGGLGWSQSLGSGKALADVIAGGVSEFDITAFSPDRFA